MGLDLMVEKATKGVRLDALYALKEAFEEHLELYLGPEKDKRESMYKDTIARVKASSKYDVIGIGEDTTDNKLVVQMTNSEFNKYKGILVKSIGEFNPDNTHLFFDWDKLSSKNLFLCSSWSIRDILTRCAKYDSNPDCNTIELDTKKLKKLGKEWGNWKIGFKLWFAKWVKYFNEEASQNIVDDIAIELGFDSSTLVEINDIIYYRNSIVKLAKDIPFFKFGKSYWLVSSY